GRPEISISSLILERTGQELHVHRAFSELAREGVAISRARDQSRLAAYHDIGCRSTRESKFGPRIENGRGIDSTSCIGECDIEVTTRIDRVDLNRSVCRWIRKTGGWRR